AALNPHGGEGGKFGDEEIVAIAPAVEATKAEGLNVFGPVPADSVFHQGLEGRYDGVLSLYHDQGHIASKTVDFHGTVSVAVVLDAGTTTGRLAAHLAHRELTVVTNGLTAILALAESPTVELIVLGGRLRQPNEAIVGASVLEQLRHIGADRVFLGTDGLSE